jgi:outer membrane protein assembly factor BamB
MPTLPRDLMYVGIAGSVVALDCRTGNERWRTRLKRSTYVMLISDGEHIFASAAGEVFCLDPTTGRILWQNRMKGLGLGMATILSPTGQGSGPPPPMSGRA